MRYSPDQGRGLTAICAAALLAACATQPPDDYITGPLPATPHVVAVWGVNIVDQAATPAAGVLPDVQLYRTPVPGSSDPHLAAPPVSALPPVYQALRVDFDEPMDATTLAGAEDLGGAPNGAASYCRQLTSPTIRLTDNADPAHPRVIASSICYDATSSVGGAPHVLIIPGSSQLTATPASPFTCQAFSSVVTGSSEFFASSHAWSLQLDAAAIKNTNGATLSLPTSAGWSAAGFAFQTSKFELMAIGFQSGVNTFFYWLAKPYDGFEPDRDPVPDAMTVTCSAGDPADKPCRLPSDATPYLLVFSRVVQSADTSSVVLQRQNGTSPDYSATAGATTIVYSFGLTASSLANVVSVVPGTRWEPGETYKLFLTSAIRADDGETLDAQSYTFTTVDTALGPPVSVPAAGAVGVSISATPTLAFQEPLTPSVIDPTHFQISDARGGSVPLTAAAVPGSNNQVVQLTPTAPFQFVPEMVYSISTNGLTVGPGAAKAGTAIPDLAPARFTVLPFGVARAAGYSAAADATTGKRTPFEVDGSHGVDPAVLFDGSLTEVFTDAAAGVTRQTLTLSEQGVASPLAITVNAADADTVAALSLTSPQAGAAIQIADAAYPLKFNQPYVLHALTSITDANAPGHSLRIYPCPGSDCSDIRFFTTEAYAPALSGPTVAGSGASQTLSFTVTFPYPFDPASLDLANSFYAFPQKADGSIDISRPVTLSCPASGNTAASISCSSTSALAPNQTYLVGATFGGTFNGKTLGAAKAASPATIPTASGKSLTVPVDAASGSFSGSVTGTVLTGC